MVEGTEVGFTVGAPELGASVGVVEGEGDRMMVGVELGGSVGRNVGSGDGREEGNELGPGVGRPEGAKVGSAVG